MKASFMKINLVYCDFTAHLYRCNDGLLLKQSAFPLLPLAALKLSILDCAGICWPCPNPLYAYCKFHVLVWFKVLPVIGYTLALWNFFNAKNICWLGLAESPSYRKENVT